MPDNNEEELNIGGVDPQMEDNSDVRPDVRPEGQKKHPDSTLSNLSVPGASPEDFLDSLLSVPEDNLIPWEECLLPSKGLYYGWQDGVVMVKAMGQKAEKIMATQRLAKSGQSIDYLFRDCCRFPDGFDPSELLLGDKIFLLYYLRGITHGNFYEFAVTCPNCEAVNTYGYDLNELAETIKYAKDELGGEPFRVSLPYLSEKTGRDVWVGIRFLRSYDSNDILARRRAKKKITGGMNRNMARSATKQARMSTDPRKQGQQAVDLNSDIEDNMEKIIVSVMGVSDQLKIRQFISRMHSLDTSTIREWLKDNTPGIDSTIILNCPDCSHEFKVELPITEGFFRPSK